MIKQKKKTSLGIVLTDRYIEAVSVETAPSRETHVRGGRMPLPVGLFRNGRFTSPAKAAVLLQKILKQEGISIRKATVLLPDSQIVAQILDLPGDLPANIHKYIHTEIRYSPILTKQTPYSDYRTLGTDDEGKEKILIGVTPQQCVENLVYTLSLAGLEILSLEMDFCALYRSVYSQVLAGQIPENLLLAGIIGQTLTICVFLNHKLDFLQRFSLAARPDAEETTTLKQLQTIKQFYEIERGCSFHQQWKILTVLDTLPRERDAWISDLHALFGEASSFYTPSDLPVHSKPEDPISFAGYGAALKGLEHAPGLPTPELLPRFFKDHYAWKRTTRITAIVAALLVLALYTGTWIFQTVCSVQGNPTATRTTRIVQLANEQKRLHREIEFLQDMQQITRDLAEQEADFSYSYMLKEIGIRIPAGLQVTWLEISLSGKISLEGRALSFDAIHQFASALAQSDQIASATVERSRVSQSSLRVYEYRILCWIRQTDKPETVQ